MKNVKTQILKAVGCSAVAFGLAQTAHASLVVDGGFESGSYGQLNNGGKADVDYSQGTLGGSLTYWNSSGFNFLFNAANAATGVDSQYGAADVSLSPTITASPDGGNFVALDADWNQGPISQQITGLTSGGQYTLSFYMALAQQYGSPNAFNGPNSAYITASLGSQSQTTPTLYIPGTAPSGWVQESLSFTATGSSELLSFLAGSPDGGEPPFILLDGVSLTAVPEPTTIIAAGLLLLPIGASLRRILRKSTAASQE